MLLCCRCCVAYAGRQHQRIAVPLPPLTEEVHPNTNGRVPLQSLLNPASAMEPPMNIEQKHDNQQFPA